MNNVLNFIATWFTSFFSIGHFDRSQRGFFFGNDTFLPDDRVVVLCKVENGAAKASCARVK